LVRTWAIVAPLEADAPVMPPVITPIVQLKVAPVTLLAKAILVVAPLHIVNGLAVVTFGVGLTVTIKLVALPGHELAVGVTIYITVPAVVPAFVSACAIVAPLDADAPVMPPVIAPMVQLNVAPVTLLAKAIFVVAPLHIVSGLAVVTFGVGLTVTIKLVGLPGQELAVGVTIYITVPAVVPAFVSACAIVAPLDAVAPVIPPVIAPMVQLKVAPVTLLAKAIFVVAPLQIVNGLAVVTSGVGLTVIVKVFDGPTQLAGAFASVGVTIIVATTGVVPAFAAVNEAIFPVPDAASPMPGTLLVHA
jgi:hypothetical protein